MAEASNNHLAANINSVKPSHRRLALWVSGAFALGVVTCYLALLAWEYRCLDQHCAFDPTVVAAFGGILAGVGSCVGAVTVIYVARDYHRRRAHEDRATLAAASRCKLRTTIAQPGGGVYTSAHVSLRNYSNDDLFDVGIHTVDGSFVTEEPFPVLFPFVAQARGSEGPTLRRGEEFEWGKDIPFDSLGLEATTHEGNAKSAAGAAIKEQVVLTFTLRGVRYARLGKKVEVLDQAPPNWRRHAPRVT